MRNLMTWKPWSFRTIASVLMVCGLLAISSGQALAQKKGGGGTTNYGNVTAWYDEETNTLYAIGDSNSNHFLVQVNDDNASVSNGMSPTLINGFKNFSTSIRPEGFSISIHGGAGNDVIEINVATQTTVFDALVEGGDGDDTLNVHVVPVPESVENSVIGNLEIRGGKGNDKINVAMLFYNLPLFVLGDLVVDAGDGNDEVTLYDRVFVAGGSVLNGGAGRDNLKLAAELSLNSLVTNFRTITFW